MNLKIFMQICIITISITFISCRSSLDMVYIQNIGNVKGQVVKTAKPVKYLLQSGDNLFVRVSSSDKDINDRFAGGSGNSSNGTVTEMGLFISSFIVNAKGFVEIPELGEIYVKGLTIDQVQDEFTKRCKVYLTGAVVVVKLTSFRFSIMGEVYRPGTYLITRDNFNIFEAISQGGDLKDYANRTEIKIIRNVPDGKKIFLLDLTNENIFTSEAFYLQSNDIIYIKQDGFKDYKLNVPTYTLILSTITSVLLILNFIK